MKVNYSSYWWKDTELALNSIVELCQKRKIIYIPFLYGTHKSINENPIMKLYSDYFEKKEIKFIYMNDERIFEGEFTNSVVDRHPNSKGHTLLAERIYAYLKPLL